MCVYVYIYIYIYIYERKALLERLVSVLQEDNVDFHGETIPNPKTDTPVECD